MKKFKKIEIKPLKTFADLNHDVVSTVELKVTRSEEVDKKLNELLKHVNKTPDATIGTKTGDEVSVSTSIRGSVNKNKTYIFPEPNPVCIYYNIANDNLKKSYNLKNKKIYNGDNHNPFKNHDLFSEYFSLTAQGIIFLITTMEGFVNQLFTEEEYNIKGKKWSKKDLEYAKLGEKISTIIPELSMVNFAKIKKTEYDRIMNTNDLRDDLIHLKRTDKSNNTSYQDLFKKLYDYDQFKNSEAVYSFLNTLKPNTFELKND